MLLNRNPLWHPYHYVRHAVCVSVSANIYLTVFESELYLVSRDDVQCMSFM